MTRLFLFCSFMLLTFCALAQDAKNVSPIRNLKVLQEYNEGSFIVTIVQYDQGSMKVTETIKKPRPLPDLVYGIRLDTIDKRFLSIVIDKGRYLVKVLYRQRCIRKYTAVFGPQPLVNKRCEGDRCTPEGVFTIVNKNPGSHYDRFMGISYPNDSAKVRFNRMKANGELPPNATIGGNVGIHGIWPGGDDMIEMGIGWTDGCIALKNKDIEELFTLVDVGTRVVIRK